MCLRHGAPQKHAAQALPCAGITREGGPSWDASCIFREEPPRLTRSEATDEQPQINQEQILHTVLIRKAAVVSTGTLGSGWSPGMSYLLRDQEVLLEIVQVSLGCSALAAFSSACF